MTISIKEAIKKVKHATSKKGGDGLPTFQSIHLERSAEGTYVVAADGFRLAYALSYEYGLVGNFNAYGDVIKSILSKKEIPENLESDTLREYPEWASLIPDKVLMDNLSSCEFNLWDLLTVSEMFSGAKSITFNALANSPFDNKIMTVSNKVSGVNFEAYMPIENYRISIEQEIKFTVNPQYLLDFCKAFRPTEYVMCRLKCNTPITPVILEHGDLTELIMPFAE